MQLTLVISRCLLNWHFVLLTNRESQYRWQEHVSIFESPSTKETVTETRFDRSSISIVTIRTMPHESGRTTPNSFKGPKLMSLFYSSFLHTAHLTRQNNKNHDSTTLITFCGGGVMQRVQWRTEVSLRCHFS